VGISPPPPWTDGIMPGFRHTQPAIAGIIKYA
jgi:hypothetical protein